MKQQNEDLRTKVNRVLYNVIERGKLDLARNIQLKYKDVFTVQDVGSAFIHQMASFRLHRKKD